MNIGMLLGFADGSSTVSKKDVQDIIDTDVKKREQSGKVDDIKVFSSRDEFPATGINDVQYVDKSTGIEYVWNGSDYVMVNETAQKSEIEDLFN